MPQKTREQLRRRRHRRVRGRVSGSTERPRLAVFRSLKHTYAQVIDDQRGITLVAASTLEQDIGGPDKRSSASAVGARIAERAKGLKITRVVFDRGGFKYHGRVAAVADAAREGGLTF
jgi:large subunit ribosomal protein L18